MVSGEVVPPEAEGAHSSGAPGELAVQEQTEDPSAIDQVVGDEEQDSGEDTNFS